MKVKPRSRQKNGRVGGNHYGAAEGYKPKRDRKVNVRAVPCPQCKVGVGEFCLKADGTPGTNYHKKRRGLAIQGGY